ncbi:hypothetical protein ACQV5M_22330, partial [Leptospira sp. SA-E8]|uniref:hypothetical protein n=1 Tax=Leptospira sp. SA-E8 TaxID=3422259 RepID=UPI003EBA5383
MSDAIALSPLAQPADAPAVIEVGAERRAPQASRRWVRVLRGLALPVLLLGFIELAAWQAWVQSRLLPPPSEVARTLWQLAHEGLA